MYPEQSTPKGLDDEQHNNLHCLKRKYQKPGFYEKPGF